MQHITFYVKTLQRRGRNAYQSKRYIRLLKESVKCCVCTAGRLDIMLAGGIEYELLFKHNRIAASATECCFVLLDGPPI